VSTAFITKFFVPWEIQSYSQTEVSATWEQFMTTVQTFISGCCVLKGGYLTRYNVTLTDLVQCRGRHKGSKKNPLNKHGTGWRNPSWLVCPPLNLKCTSTDRAFCLANTEPWCLVLLAWNLTLYWLHCGFVWVQISTGKSAIITDVFTVCLSNLLKMLS